MCLLQRRGTTIFVVYVDDGLVLDTKEARFSTFVKELRDIVLKVDDQGHPADYVGVNINNDNKGHYHFSQVALIDAIIEDVGLTRSHKVKQVPANVSQQLHAFPESPTFQGTFNYRLVVGKLNYLAQTTRPDICTATHMSAKFSHDHRKEHGEAIVWLVMYLKNTQHIGLSFKPDPSKGFENYCDTDFSWNWNRLFAHNDPVLLPNLDQDGLFSMLDVRSFGHLKSKGRRPYQLQRQNTLPCPSLSGI